jgi:UDP-2,4-diacetamido-2,4,6-trideoxy-beta-L-altropyranose hydrolase
MAKILVRADASAAMGTGHVMRCLALVEILQERGHACRFAMAETTPALASLLSGRGLPIDLLPGPAGGARDLARLRSLASAADAVVIDGYHFSGPYRAGLAPRVGPILAWDDGGPPIPLHATMVVNASSSALPEDYAARAPGALLLLGPCYLPLRREIRDLIGSARPGQGPLLVSFGGSDPIGLTAPVLGGLAPEFDGWIDAVLGGSVADPGPALEVCAAFPDRIRLHRDTPQLGRLMLGARLAVSAAGGTLAELAALRTPSLLVAVAGNQREAAGISAGHGWCVAVDASEENAVPRIVETALELWSDPARLARMSAAATGLVDGGGPVRLADALETAIAQCGGP